MDITFDGKTIEQGEIVSPNAIVQLQLSDGNPLNSKDSTSIVLYFQGCDKCSFQKIPFKKLQISQPSPQSLLAQYQLPALPSGNYKIYATGKDIQGNTVGNNAIFSFQISDKYMPTVWRVMPNPTSTYIKFRYEIISKDSPTSGYLEVYDTNAKKIIEQNLTPHIGINEVEWALNIFSTAKGILLYKASIVFPSKQESFSGKIVVE